MNLYFVIIILLLLFSIEQMQIKFKYSLIEMRNSYNTKSKYNKYIQTHFIVFHVENKKRINISGSIYFIEHNTIYDDILFIIQLYSILIKSRIIVICNNYNNNRIDYINIYRIKKYSTISNCIYIDIIYLKKLHLHSNIFRFCKFDEVYNILKNRKIIFNKIRICKNEKYSQNFSIVTTVYKRHHLEKQISFFLNQSIPPKHIIVVHDRNIVKLSHENFDIIYIHTINFQAGFYFRYLMSVLSPENEVIIYDDDWFPYQKLSHIKWIDEINSAGDGLFAHRSGRKNGIRWCATPLIIHRKLLLLMWYIDIFEVRAAEDGHLSFSLLLLCNIKCKQIKIKGLKDIVDKLSSSKPLRIPAHIFWSNYTIDVKNKINSSFTNNIKKEYNIY